MQWLCLLGQAWASPTLAWLHCARVCVYICLSIYVCLDQLLTVNLKSAHSNISQWLNFSATKPRKQYCQTAGSTWNRVKVKTIHVECIGSTYGNFLNHGTSLTIAWQGRLQVTVGQQGVHWFQVRSWHDRSYVAWISLLAHGTIVKLSPCPCSHSSLAGRIGACLWGHSKCNLLLAQARPRMIQHLTSF